MTDAKTCPTCGAPLPADATGGACPKCLLQAGFATGGAAPAGHVPTPEELAPKFPGLVIEEMLGRGGMGVVYRARHKALDRSVALKVLPSNVAADRAFADRFQREARALAKLQHPNIVAVHDFGETEGVFWLVMEYVDGANIRQAMKAGTIGPKEALAIVPQICDALQYAHEHGVVHRDIKPENVLLDRAGRVKVADFGLAKLMEHGESDRMLTGAGQVMGTPHYMAPEQWEKPTTVDHRADIYSLGVVFYEMLTGELPIGRFAAPSKKSDIDARIDEIVMRTLEKEREARYQNVSQVKTDVGALSTPADPAPTAADRPRRVLWPWAVAAALLVLCGGPAAIVALFALSSAAPTEHQPAPDRAHTDSPPAPEPSHEEKVDELRRVREFWTRFGRARAVEESGSGLEWYAPAERERLRALAEAARDRGFVPLSLGLPLVPPVQFTAPMRDYRMTSMASSRERHPHLGPVVRIRFEAASATQRLRCWLVTGIAGDEASVYFDEAPVEIE